MDVHIQLVLMPNWFIELLACWHGGVWSHTAASIWGAILHCIVWTIWREQNNWIFEGEEQSIIELGIFILSLFKWITVLSGLSISSLFPFIHSLCTWVTAFFVVTIFFFKFSMSFYLSIKKKKKGWNKVTKTRYKRPLVKRTNEECLQLI